MKTMHRSMIDPKTIKLHPEFVKAFEIDEGTLTSITQSMQTNGYDNNQPVIIWFEKDCLIDGHTRSKASVIAGLQRIPVVYVSFDSEHEAAEYIERLQFDRRNLTEKQKLQRLISNQTVLKKQKNKKEYVARILHCSERTAMKYLNILKDPYRLSLVMDEKESVNAATTMKQNTGVDRVKKVQRILADEISIEELKEIEKMIKAKIKAVKQ